MLYSSSLLRCIADSFRLLKYWCVGGVSPAALLELLSTGYPQNVMASTYV